MLALTPHPGWVGTKVSRFEEATGGRVGVVTRFGVGRLPSQTPVLQAGDTVHLFTTEDQITETKALAAAPPED